MAKLKPFSQKVRQSVQKCLNRNSVLGSILQNDFEATLSSKMNVLSVWKGHLSVFIKFLSEEVETFFWESVLKYLMQHLVLRSFLENGFEATLSSRTNILSVWKGHFSVFIKFLSEEVEILFLESEAKRSKLFKSTFGQRTLLRNDFEATLSSKMNLLNVLKGHF